MPLKRLAAILLLVSIGLPACDVRRNQNSYISKCVTHQFTEKQKQSDTTYNAIGTFTNNCSDNVFIVWKTNNPLDDDIPIWVLEESRRLADCDTSIAVIPAGRTNPTRVDNLLNGTKAKINWCVEWADRDRTCSTESGQPSCPIKNKYLYKAATGDLYEYDAERKLYIWVRKSQKKTKAEAIQEYKDWLYHLEWVRIPAINNFGE